MALRALLAPAFFLGLVAAAFGQSAAPGAGSSGVPLSDIRGTGTITATAGQVVNIRLNGTASAGLTFSGITSSAATIAFNTSNDGGTTYLTKGAVNCAAPGANPTTLTADGQTRIDVAGATNLQISVTAGTGANITYSYNLSAAPVACPNVPVQAVELSSGTLTGTTAAPLANSTYTDGGFPTTGGGSIEVSALNNTGNSLYYEYSPDNKTTWLPAYGEAVSGYNNAAGSVTSYTSAAADFRTFKPQGTHFRVRAGAANATASTAVVLLKAAPVAARQVNAANVPGTALTVLQTSVSSFSRITSSTASTNATLAKASAGRVLKIVVCNTTTTPFRIKFYDTATAPTPGTTAVKFTRPVPAAAAAGGLACPSYDLADLGWAFTTGIAYAMTTGAADTDATALAAGQATDVSVEYQ